MKATSVSNFTFKLSNRIFGFILLLFAVHFVVACFLLLPNLHNEENSGFYLTATLFATILLFLIALLVARTVNDVVMDYECVVKKRAKDSEELRNNFLLLNSLLAKSDAELAKEQFTASGISLSDIDFKINLSSAPIKIDPLILRELLENDRQINLEKMEALGEPEKLPQKPKIYLFFERRFNRTLIEA